MSTKPTVQWPIHSDRTAIIVVDMQKVFCEPDGALYVENTKDIIEPIQSLLMAARKKALPVIYLRHIVRGDGSDTGRMRDLYPNADEILKRGIDGVEIIDELTPEITDIIVDKPFYSGFIGTDLDTILRANDVDTVIICGTVTNVCCETTARDAVHREYKVVYLSDANAAMDYPDMGWGKISATDIQRMTLTVMSYEFGQVASTEEVIRLINEAE